TLVMTFPNSGELENCHHAIKPYIHHTPVMTSITINRLTGSTLFFKCENFQKMGAFKMRGAMNAVIQLRDGEKKRGVATHSSGNFAQALSLAARNLGLKAWIVMPSTAPRVKKDAVRGYGAEIVECEPTQQAREETLETVVARTGAVFVHPSNNIKVIAGNSTAAIELIRETGPLDAIITPVGGGGLLAGTALAADYLNPGCDVYAGEPFGADDAYHSFHSGMIKPSVNPVTIADGLKTSLGDVNFPIIQKRVKEIIRVEEEEIIAAMRLIWERMKIIVEPSSAVALAAVMRENSLFRNKRTGIILSGGNVDLANLPF
ncbi:MAG TPA: pyridoxal-phosphate dependent enzyme, partial [Bacteroidales bacterium]|nr:pyridoxal-phosphate dependent enzyme [Bacteroidales bacterium]